MNVLPQLFIIGFLTSVKGYRGEWRTGYSYPEPTPQEIMVDTVNYIGLVLLHTHNQNNENNIALSPYGATSVLVALTEGLRGKALKEILDATLLPVEVDVTRIGLRDIHRHLKSYFIPQEGFLAGLTFSHENVTLKESYESILKFYGFDIDAFNSALYPDYSTTQLPLTTSNFKENKTKTTSIPLNTTYTFSETTQDVTSKIEVVNGTTNIMTTTSKSESTMHSTSYTVSTAMPDTTTILAIKETPTTITTSTTKKSKPGTVSSTKPTSTYEKSTSVLNTTKPIFTSTSSTTKRTTTSPTTTTTTTPTTLIITTTLPITTTRITPRSTASTTSTTTAKTITTLPTATTIKTKTTPPITTTQITPSGTVSTTSTTTAKITTTLPTTTTDETTTTPLIVTMRMIPSSIVSTTSTITAKITTALPSTATIQPTTTPPIPIIRKTPSTTVSTTSTTTAKTTTKLPTTTTVTTTTRPSTTTTTSTGTTPETTIETSPATITKTTPLPTIIPTTPLIATKTETTVTSNEPNTITAKDNLSTTTKPTTITTDFTSTLFADDTITTTTEAVTEMTTVPSTTIKTTMPITNATEKKSKIRRSVPINLSATIKVKPIKYKTQRPHRSPSDYLIAKYYDTNAPSHIISRYEPIKPKTFLVNGKIRESNISFMTYDTVLPFRYISYLNALAVSFPLDSTKYYLLLVLPIEETGVDSLVDNIMSTTLKQIIYNLQPTRVKATIPSFMLKGFVILTPTLQKLGIRSIFEPRRADFYKMTNAQNIYVTNVEQAITVTIRNYVNTTDLYNNEIYQRRGPVVFNADHPFLYFVMDSEIHVALMAGKMINPLNSRIR